MSNSYFDSNYSSLFSGGKFDSPLFTSAFSGNKDEGSTPPYFPDKNWKSPWDIGSSLEKGVFDSNKKRAEQDDSSAWGRVKQGLRFAGEVFNQPQNDPYGRSSTMTGRGDNDDIQSVFPNFGIYTPRTRNPYTVGGESGGKGEGVGSAIGTVAGGILGSVVPGIGTVAGAGLGRVAGGALFG